MTISTVHDNGTVYTVTLISGIVIYVPKDSENADYQRVQAWITAGGVLS